MVVSRCLVGELVLMQMFEMYFNELVELGELLSDITSFDMYVSKFEVKY